MDRWSGFSAAWYVLLYLLERSPGSGWVSTLD
jgi:hypothetical protein